MIRLGLYGCGNRTRALLDALIHDDFYQVKASYDLRTETALDLATKYGGRICNSPEELIACTDVDAFIISLSPFAHAEALRQTIPKGKPIFVEKPVSFSAKEVRELAELAEQNGTLVQVGFMRRYLPETLACLDYIRNHQPGQIFNVEGQWLHHGAIEMNYNLYHHPDNFRLQVSQIPFHCCHMLDVLMLMNGPVKSVSSQLIKVIERPYPSPDDLTANLVFRNGANGRFHYSSMVYYGEMSYRFHAENYSLKMNCGTKNLEIYRKPRFHTSEIGSHPEQCLDFHSFNQSYQKCCQPLTINFEDAFHEADETIMYDFVRMARDGCPPEANLRVATRVQGLAEAIELSGKLQRPLELDDLGMPILEN